ncbi:hypothetical protein K458DRAFT_418523 [Lentithecium fluviatile CBS 122367]|uniref:C2H2-type domain-containing protein n=1 Tax=Lentithecium fluviatile CBS 122367 TaxID=1168545 RepID=A0A6G1J1H7_9PLEO|nr:hypothetical protein K458DRAFT_418523 [Lentithecium fluviatile CBS 122367]
MPTAAAAGTQPNGQVAGATTSALRGEPVAASTVFKCGACSKEFGSKKARQQHKKSVRHKTASAGTAVVGPGAATPGRNTGRVPSAPTTTRSIAATHSSVLGVDSTIDRYHADDDELDGSDPESDDSDDSDDRASRDLQWHGGSFGNDDQDWSVCDKDCGWCGHCADGLDI